MEIKEAKQLVKLARKAILSKKIAKSAFNEKRGVFVTILTYPEKELRGCIGYAEPVFTIGEGIQRAAVCAAYSDPRFPPLTKEELDKVLVEISILTPGKLIKGKTKEEILEGVEAGKDGVIIHYGRDTGLFLPQVWEQLPGKEDFLNALCLKCMLPHGMWIDKSAELYKFNVEAFVEEKPNGSIIKVRI